MKQAKKYSYHSSVYFYYTLKNRSQLVNCRIILYKDFVHLLPVNIRCKYILDPKEFKNQPRRRHEGTYIFSSKLPIIFDSFVHNRLFISASIIDTRCIRTGNERQDTAVGARGMFTRAKHPVDVFFPLFPGSPLVFFVFSTPAADVAAAAWRFKASRCGHQDFSRSLDLPGDRTNKRIDWNRITLVPLLYEHPL